MATASILRSLLAFMSIALFSRALCTRAHVVPALYVFGDSFVDAGNNNFLNTLAKTNFTPYGIDLYGKLPLGRATNGLTYADFIGIIGKCLSLSNQVAYFGKTVRHDLPRQIPLKEELKLHLEKSIILISIVGNDYTIGYLLDEEMRKKHDIASYTKLLVHSLAAKVEEIEQQCKELGKEIIPSYNAHLVKSLDRLTAKHGILYTIIVPKKVEIKAVGMEIGSKFIDEPCCKINEFGGCIKDSEPCKNRDDYMYFDAGRPTQAYHKFVADHCFDGNSGTCTPYSILELSAK
ncbi:hypothetical protein MLD38_024340 [Melastoma candidum]|uniref:Uncharacterized protein n=1 Tax=Melastoma candidum TaxID=119954 RepID=A0ACB9NSZ2_9MYRT|nr:hypothetical protein MLD38_024340 [Melastoma candidum]